MHWMVLQQDESQTDTNGRQRIDPLPSGTSQSPAKFGGQSSQIVTIAQHWICGKGWMNCQCE